MPYTCPACTSDLQWKDEYFTGRPESFYGNAANGIHYPSTKQHLGDIYQCMNEDCECFQSHFHTRNGELIEGYPF